MKSKNSRARAWEALEKSLRDNVPSLFGELSNEGSFVELRVKARNDGTTLTILKVDGPDGGPLVCFGSGYGAAGALMAIDATIQGGRWRADKPWPRNSGS